MSYKKDIKDIKSTLSNVITGGQNDKNSRVKVELPSGSTSVDTANEKNEQMASTQMAIMGGVSNLVENGEIFSSKSKSSDNIFGAMNERLNAIANFLCGTSLNAPDNVGRPKSTNSLSTLVNKLLAQLKNPPASPALPMPMSAPAAPSVASQLLIDFNNTGDVIGLIEALTKLEEASNGDNADTAIQNLTSFLQAIYNFSEFDKKDRKNAKKAISWIKKYIATDIVKIIDELEKTKDKTIASKETFVALSSFFISLTKLTDLDKQARKNIKSSVEYIKDYIVNDIQSILEKLRERGENSKETLNSDEFKAINILFETLTGLVEITNAQRRRIRSNVVFYKSLIENEVSELITTLIGIGGPSENAKNSIILFSDVLNIFDDIADTGLGSLLLMRVKLELYKSHIEFIRDGILPSLTSLTGIEAAITTATNTKDMMIKMSEVLDEMPGIVDLAIGILQFKLLNKTVDKIKIFYSKFQGEDGISSRGMPQKLDSISNTITKYLDILKNVANGDTETGAIGLANIVDSLSHLQEVIESLKTLTGEESPLNGIDANKIEEVKDKLKGAADMLGSFKDVCSALGAAGPGALMVRIFSKALKKVPDVLKTIVDGINDLPTNEDTQKKLESAKAISAVIAVCAFTLIIAGLVIATKPKIIVGALAFAMIFPIFVNLLMAAFDNKQISMSLESAKAVSVLIAVCSLCLLIPGLIVSTKPKIIIGALTFGLVLAGFVALLMWSLNGKDIKNATAGAKELAILIGVISLCLIIPGLLITLKPKILLGTLGFALILAGFIALVSWALNKKDLSKATAGAMELAILIGVITLCLIIPGLLIALKPTIIWGTLSFALMLAGFIIFITRVAFSNKNIENIVKAQAGATALTILIGTATFAMLIGGLLLMNFPELWLQVTIFTGLLTGFVLAMAGIAWLLNKFKTDFKNAAKIVGFLTVITALGFASFLLIRIAAKIYGDNPILALACIGGFVAALGILAGGYALIGLLVVPLLPAIGAAALVLGITTLSLVTFTLVKIAMAILGNSIKAKIAINTFGEMVRTLAGDMAGLALYVIPLALALPAAILLGSILMVLSTPLLLIANTLDILAKLKGKKINFSSIISNIQGIGTLIDAVLKYIPTDITVFWRMLIVQSSIQKLANMIGVISEAIQDYAELKVPVGWDKKGKVTQYRHLASSDFKAAAKNVSTIINVLGKAVMDSYNANPDMFSFTLLGDNPFVRTIKSNERMAKMITKIASAVKAYASMLVPMPDSNNEIKVDKDGKPLHYQKLEKGDFVAAADNVSTILSVLGNAIVQVYNANPNMYDTTNAWAEIFGGVGGGSPFVRTIKTNMQLANLITKIASAVKAYASMLIPLPEENGEVKVDKDGKPKRYQQLSSSDFNNAAENVKSIISVMGQAIVDEYVKHKEWYDEPNFGQMLLGTGGGSPFTKTIKANMKLANLITKIASAVKSYASMIVPFPEEDGEVKVDKDGKPKRYQVLKKTDFVNAASNVQLILSTLGEAIVATYEAHPDMYKNGGFLGMGDNPFEKTINTNNQMAKLITKIACAVKTYASLMVPLADENTGQIEIDKDGKPRKYRILKNKDFKDAANNVKTILSTLGEAIIKTYNDNKEMYKDGGFLGMGTNPFTKTVKANTKMGEMISKIASTIKDIYELKIPLYDEKTGEIIKDKYKVLTKREFVSAAENIDTIITVLGKSIVSQFEKHEDWFDDGEDSIFAETSTALGKMGEMINSIATGIGNMADLKIAIKYDDKGNPIEYRALKPEDFTDAATNIDKVISTLGKTITDTITNHPDWFEDGEESPFVLATTAIQSMGEGIAAIAEAINIYSELKFPKSYNPDGTVKDYVDLNDKSVFEAMSNNISLVMTNMATTLLDVYYGKADKNGVRDYSQGISQMLEAGDDQENTPLGSMLEAVNAMGDAIASIADGILAYASGQYTDSKGVIHALADTDFSKASENIAKVITNLGTAIVNVYNNATMKELFMDAKEIDNGIFSKTEKTIPGSSPFAIIIGGAVKMGQAINAIAQGIAVYANNQFYDEKTNSWITLDYDAASKNIGDVLVTIGEKINTVYAKNKPLFTNNTALKTVSDFYIKVGGVLNPIANAIKSYASMEIPSEYNRQGKPTKFKKLTDTDFGLAAARIETILSYLGNALEKISLKVIINSLIFGKSGELKEGSPVTDFLNSMQTLTGILSGITSTIGFFATGFFPEITGYDKQGKPIYSLRKISDKEFEQVGANITKVATGLANAVVDSTKEFKEKMKNIDMDDIKETLTTISSVTSTLTGIQSAITTVNDTKFLEITNAESIKASLSKSLNVFSELATEMATTISNLTSSIELAKPGENAGGLLGLVGLKLKEPVTETLKKGDKISEMFTNIIAVFSSAIDSYKDITKYNKLYQENYKNLNLTDLTSSINNIISQVSDNIHPIKTTTISVLLAKLGIFKGEVAEVSKFINVVNTFNVSKAKSVQSLVESLYKLAGKMDMSKLADVLDKKLNGTLIQLTKRIREAQITILRAEEIQKNRHKAIEQSISKVSELMNTKLCVEVSQLPAPTTPSSEDTEYKPTSEGNIRGTNDPTRPANRAS